MSADLEPLDLTPDEARLLTDEIRAQADILVPLVAEAYRRRAWRALGYESWDQYRAAEFPAVRVAVDARPEAVRELREAGMSQRQIGAALGVSAMTVNRIEGAQPDVSDVTSDTQTAMSGGREYTRTAPERTIADPLPAPIAAEVADRIAERQAEAERYAGLDAQLDAAMEDTASRFRANWSAAVVKACQIWSFDADRLVEVYATDFDASIERAFFHGLEQFIDQVREARRRHTSGLRVIKGGRAS